MLEKLKDLRDMLENSLLSEAPLVISESVDPSRALILREACLYRMSELTNSVYESFKKDNLITAFILTRAIMETQALFCFFLDKLEKSIKSRDIEKIRTFLSKALTGAKAAAAKESGRKLNPLHVLELVRDFMGKDIPHFYEHYEFLSEFSHPNAAGLNESYARIDYDEGKIFFGLNREKLNSDSVLRPLLGLIQAFTIRYDASALLLKDFIILCEELLEKSQSQITSPVKG